VESGLTMVKSLDARGYACGDLEEELVGAPRIVSKLSREGTR